MGLAEAREEMFINPPKRRNRLWQADFSELETTAAGTWNLGGVVDYWGKVNLACHDASSRRSTVTVASVIRLCTRSRVFCPSRSHINSPEADADRTDPSTFVSQP